MIGQFQNVIMLADLFDLFGFQPLLQNFFRLESWDVDRTFVLVVCLFKLLLLSLVMTHLLLHFNRFLFLLVGFGDKLFFV